MARGRKGWELTHCADTGWAARGPAASLPLSSLLGWGRWCVTWLRALNFTVRPSQQSWVTVGTVGCPAPCR